MSFFAISDIHGMADEFEELLDKIGLSKTDTLVTLGDCIDRGPDPKGVIDTILDLRKRGYKVVSLLGNHEDIFMSHLKRSTPAAGYGNYCYRGIRDGYYVKRNGGTATLKSYNYDTSLIKTHYPYYSNLRLYLETDKYIFVHGGLKPNVPLQKQQKYDMLWIRGEFIYSPFNFGKTVVYGHTMQSVIYRQRGNKIGIDTGAYFDGELSCLRLPNFRVFSVDCGKQYSDFSWEEDSWNYLWANAGKVKTNGKAKVRNTCRDWRNRVS